MSVTVGCATGMSPFRPSFDMPPAYDAAARSALAPAVLDRWWLLYDDPKLTSLVALARAQGFTAREAIARLEEARAIRAAALSRFWLQGNLQGSAEVTQSVDLDDPGSGDPETSTTANIVLPVSWELDLFGRRAATRRVAEADLAAARFDYEAANAAVAAEVARTLFQSRGLAVQLEDAEANVRIQRELLDVLEVRVERGLTARSQADRVAADVALAQAQVLALRAEIDAARRVLLVLVGEGLDPLATMPVAAEIGTVPPVPDTLPGDLLQRRPDVRQAEARLRAAAGRVRLAELEFFPRLTLQPGVGVSLTRGAVDATTGFWSLGLGLVVPILDRPRLAAALDAESARARQAVIGYERAVQTAFSEADQALRRLAADLGRVDLLADGEARARRAFEAARTRFDLGLSDLQEVLDAERAWRATRTASTDARIDALLRSVQVFQALGGGWPAAPFAPTGVVPEEVVQ